MLDRLAQGPVTLIFAADLLLSIAISGCGGNSSVPPTVDMGSPTFTPDAQQFGCMSYDVEPAAEPPQFDQATVEQRVRAYAGPAYAERGQDIELRDLVSAQYVKVVHGGPLVDGEEILPGKNAWILVFDMKPPGQPLGPPLGYVNRAAFVVDNHDPLPVDQCAGTMMRKG